ncbi:MAG: hypothetical protein VX986_03985 [Pseudomonadota bacterium]|nr:hypothetical protein [Pseudomonadota bacterium]
MVERVLKRKAKGERPYFFEDNNIDKLVSMIMGLAGETSVLMERLDTVERLLEEKGVLTEEEIEMFNPSDTVLEARTKRREIFLGEILRIIEIELEADSLEDNSSYDNAVKEVEKN